jgi:hypothetical protein
MKKQTIHQIIEWSAWVGSLLILGGYFLLATGVVDGNAIVYHLMILLGSIALGVIAYVKNVMQSVFLNVVFSILAIIALVRVIFL